MHDELLGWTDIDININLINNVSVCYFEIRGKSRYPILWFRME